MKEIEKTLATMKARAKETVIVVLLYRAASLIVSVPKIWERIDGGVTHLMGNFTKKEADSIALKINSSVED